MVVSLEGIHQKLIRAEQNIVNLNAEITAFLDIGGKRIIPDNDKQGMHEAVLYHRSRKVPARFSVLCGEIFHNLRSTLDHIAWQLVIAIGKKPRRSTSFPIFPEEPTTEDELERWDGHVKGMRPSAETKLRALQPYHLGPNFSDDPLLIISRFNNTDKHREVLMISICDRHGQTFRLGEGDRFVVTMYYDTTESIEPGFMAEGPMKMHGQLVFHVAFPKVGRAINQPVVPCLQRLNSAVWATLEHFRVTGEF